MNSGGPSATRLGRQGTSAPTRSPVLEGDGARGREQPGSLCRRVDTNTDEAVD